MSIVVDTPYNSTRGRKPSRPAFLFDMHNDAAGGTTIVDRFGNARDLTLEGTLGSAWTTSRGFLVPNGTDQQALTSSGTGADYAAQTVMADAILTAGNALFVAWRIGWAADISANEQALTLGRNATSSGGAVFNIGQANSKRINLLLRGTNASTTSSAGFGGSELYTIGPTHSCAVYVEHTTDGVIAQAWLNGVTVGTPGTLLWTANGGGVPTVSTFGMPDGITIGAQRAGGISSPTWSQRIGGSNSGQTRLANVLAVNLGVANYALASDLALELHQYPRHIGEILAGI